MSGVDEWRVPTALADRLDLRSGGKVWSGFNSAVWRTARHRRGSTPQSLEGV
jgi:hypothetical protein